MQKHHRITRTTCLRKKRKSLYPFHVHAYSGVSIPATGRKAHRSVPQTLSATVVVWEPYRMHTSPHLWGFMFPRTFQRVKPARQIHSMPFGAAKEGISFKLSQIRKQDLSISLHHRSHVRKVWSTKSYAAYRSLEGLWLLQKPAMCLHRHQPRRPFNASIRLCEPPVSCQLYGDPHLYILMFLHTHCYRVSARPVVHAWNIHLRKRWKGQYYSHACFCTRRSFDSYSSALTYSR